MNISLSGQEVIAFLVFCTLIAPALMAVGMLWNRVRGLERRAVDNSADHERIFAKLDEIGEMLGYMKGRTNGEKEG